MAVLAVRNISDEVHRTLRRVQPFDLVCTQACVVLPSKARTAGLMTIATADGYIAAIAAIAAATEADGTVAADVVDPHGPPRAGALLRASRAEPRSRSLVGADGTTRGSPLLPDHALVQEHEVVRDLARKAHLVRDDDHRAARGGQIADAPSRACP